MNENKEKYKADVNVGVSVEEEDGIERYRTTFFGGYYNPKENKLAIQTAVWGSLHTEETDTQKYSVSALVQRELAFPLSGDPDWRPAVIQVCEYLDASGDVQGTVCSCQVVDVHDGDGALEDNPEVISGEVADVAAHVVYVHRFARTAARRTLGCKPDQFSREVRPCFGAPRKEKKEEAKKEVKAKKPSHEEATPAECLVSLEAVNAALKHTGFQLAVINGRVELWKRWIPSETYWKQKKVKKAMATMSDVWPK